MPDINIIKVDGKPVSKLLDVIKDAIGTIYRPTAIRNEADAEAYKIKTVERAKSEALVEGKEREAEMYQRMQERLSHQELQHQLNIDAITQIAADQLNKEDTVSEEPVNKDWTARFFSIAEDISDVEMQALWGRILAGEVKQPKSFSLRTLELLKNLSTQEANIFMKVANYAIESRGVIEHFLYKGQYRVLEQHGITYQDILRLTESGLIQPGETVVLPFSPEAQGKHATYLIGKYVIIANIHKCNGHSIPIYLFTKSGAELLKLLEIEPNLAYLSEFAGEFNPSTKVMISDVKYGTILSKTNDEVTYAQPLLEFPK